MKHCNEEMEIKIVELRNRGAIFFINHSAGKDSQTMTLELAELIPVNQLVAVYADLKHQAWSGIVDHIKATLPVGVKLIKCSARRDFFTMAQERGVWASPKCRQCTSDLKRTPIEKVIRHELKDRGKLLAVSCMGIRAEESHSRAKAAPIKMNKRLSKAGREVWDLLPIKDFSTEEVFGNIKEAGQQPHWIYKHLGRLSCVVCIFSTPKDVRVALELRPDVFNRIVQIEKDIDFTLKQGKSLEEFAQLDDRRCGGCDI